MSEQKKKTVVISQPMYFPWPGFLEHMALADVLIWLDDAQFSKGSFTNRIQVKLNNDQKWMSVPLHEKGTNKLIGELQSGDTKWKGAHRDLLRQCFQKAPHRTDAIRLYDEAVSHTALLEIIIASAEGLGRETGVLPPRILRSGAMNVSGHSSQRVLDLVKQVGGTRYVTGHGAADYLDHEGFEAQGVSVDYMNYSHMPWPQAGTAFTPYVTSLDLIAATGSDAKNFLHPATVGWRDFMASRHGD